MAWPFVGPPSLLALWHAGRKIPDRPVTLAVVFAVTDRAPDRPAGPLAEGHTGPTGVCRGNCPILLKKYQKTSQKEGMGKRGNAR